MDKLLEALAVPWTRRWSGRVAAAAIVFWALGLYLLLLTERPTGAPRCPASAGVAVPWCRTVGLGPVGWTLLGLLGTAVLAGSALLVAAATSQVLLLLAGEWNGPFGRWCQRVMLRRTLARHRALRRTAPPRPDRSPPSDRPIDRVRFVGGPVRLWRIDWAESADVLHARRRGGATAALRRYPVDTRAFAPTRIGCLLAALGERLRARHGLDLALSWELFLAVLPPEPRRALDDESRRLVLRVQTLVWTVATLVWTPWFPGPWRMVWPVAVLLVVRLLHVGLREGAEEYCDLIEALFALHRDRIYSGLGWPLPENTAGERVLGAALTGYLRGREFTEDQPLDWPDPVVPPLEAVP